MTPLTFLSCMFGGRRCNEYLAYNANQDPIVKVLRAMAEESHRSRQNIDAGIESGNYIRDQLIGNGGYYEPDDRD